MLKILGLAVAMLGSPPQEGQISGPDVVVLDEPAAFTYSSTKPTLEWAIDKGANFSDNQKKTESTKDDNDLHTITLKSGKATTLVGTSFSLAVGQPREATKRVMIVSELATSVTFKPSKDDQKFVANQPVLGRFIGGTDYQPISVFVTNGKIVDQTADTNGQYLLKTAAEYTVLPTASGPLEFSFNHRGPGAQNAQRSLHSQIVAPTSVDPTVSASTLSLVVGQAKTIEATNEDSAATFTYKWEEVGDNKLLEIPTPTARNPLIRALKRGSTKLKLTLIRTINDIPSEPTSTEIEVTVSQALNSMVFDMGTETMVPASKERLIVRVYDADGAEVVDPDVKVEGTPVNLKVEEIGSTSIKNDFTITAGSKSEDGRVTFVCKRGDFTDGAIRATLVISVRSVSGFAPVSVDLDMMDERTVGDIFGGQIAQQYYVMSVRLVNRLTGGNGRQAESILVYGQSFDTIVQFEREKIGDNKKREWTPVTLADVVDDFNVAHENPDNRIPSRLKTVEIEATSAGRIQVSPLPRVTLAVGDTMRIRAPEGSIFEPSPTATHILDVERETGVITGKAVGTVAVLVKHKTGTDPLKVISRIECEVVHAEGCGVELKEKIEDPLPIAAGYTYRAMIAEPGVWEFKISDRNGSIDPETGFFQMLKPGVAVISAKKKKENPDDPEVSRYLALRSVSLDGTSDLPPSVFQTPEGLKRVAMRFRYRPVAQEVILLGQDFRAFNYSENQIRRYIGVAGQILGFMLGKDTGNNRLGEWSSAVTGIISPAFDRLSPDLSNIHRNNLVTQGMKALEEVPPGAELRRVVFFPKAAFQNGPNGQKIRIGRIDTSQFRIAVAVITQKETVSGQPGEGTGGGN